MHGRLSVEVTDYVPQPGRQDPAIRQPHMAPRAAQCTNLVGHSLRLEFTLDHGNTTDASAPSGEFFPYRMRMPRTVSVRSGWIRRIQYIPGARVAPLTKDSEWCPAPSEPTS